MNPSSIFLAALMFNVQQQALGAFNDALSDKVSRMVRGEEVDTSLSITLTTAFPEELLSELADDVLEQFADQPEGIGAVATLKSLWDEEV